MDFLIKEFPNNPREISDDDLLRLKESMAEYGSLDGFVVNVAPGKYQYCIISGNQKHKHADLNSAKIEFSERYKKPTASGTVSIGRVLFEGEWFPYREVYWSEDKCEIGNLRANNYGGHNDVERLMTFNSDVLKFGGVDLSFEMQVNDIRTMLSIETDPTTQNGYAEKNKEIDVDSFEDKMTISLNYTADEYWKVKTALSEHGQTPEQAVWQLLNLGSDE